MNWNKITSLDQLESIKLESEQSPVLLFKHSTTCSISATALDRFERGFNKLEDTKDIKFYYLDLLNHRDISKKIAEEFAVVHQSPQAILLKDGEAVYDASHYEISIADVVEAV
jgi:bacillithiol system protein YtxJ